MASLPSVPDSSETKATQTPIYGPAMIKLRDFMVGQTLYLALNDTFTLDRSVPKPVHVVDEQIVASEPGQQDVYRALTAGKTQVETTYNLCQGITGQCSGPALFLTLKVIVQ